MRQCPSCSRITEENVEICPTCGNRFVPRKKKPKYPEVAGVLMMISALLAIFFALYSLITLGEMIQSVETYLGEETYLRNLENILKGCFAAVMGFGVIQMIGGILSVKRRYWVFAVFAGLIGIFSVGFFFISSVLSFIALILLSMSREEFS
ncbi:MAG: hypothetical protein R6U17_09955 [Thermoplasmata archaeon]